MPTLYTHWDTLEGMPNNTAINASNAFYVISTEDVNDIMIYFWWFAIGRWK